MFVGITTFGLDVYEVSTVVRCNPFPLPPDKFKRIKRIGDDTQSKSQIFSSDTIGQAKLLTLSIGSVNHDIAISASDLNHVAGHTACPLHLL